MSLLMENSVAKIGCGDPGDPIAFGASFEGSNYLRFMDPTTSNQKAMFDFWFKGISSAFNSYIYSSPDLAGSSYFYLGRSGEKISIVHRDVSNQFEVHTVASLRDAARYRGLNLVIDTTQAVPEDRIKLRLGGVQVELTGTFPPLNFAMNKFGGAVNQYISTWVGSYGTPADGPGHLGARFIYTDDLDAYSYLDFGRFNADGDWVPKTPEDVTGLRYFVPFSDPSNMGLNLAGDDLVEVGAITQTRDTPTRDFATLDPNYPMSPAPALSEGNLRSDRTSNQGTQISVSTLPWYGADVYAVAEILANAQHSSFIGVLAPNQDFTGNYTGSLPKSAAYEQQSGAILLDGSTVQTGLPTATVGDRVGVFVSTSGLVTFYKNEAPIGVPVSIADWYEDDGLLFGHSSGGDGESVRWNFGQLDSPAYIPPSGYAREDVSMSADNLPCPETLDPSTLVTVYEGVAASVDLPWNPITDKTLILSEFLDETKETRVVDTVRGNSIPFAIDTTGAEITTDPDGLVFRAGGYDIGSSSAYTGRRRDYIFRANRLSGMDILDPIVSDGVTPITAPHQTGGVIHCGWFIPLDGGSRRMFHHELAADQYVRLEDDTVAQADAGWFGCTANDISVLLPSGRWLPILWTTKRQYSAFKKIIGHANGAVVPMDFTPRIVFMRASNTTNGLHLVCSDSSEGNPISKISPLYTGGVETSEAICDLNSLGIKMRNPSFNPAGQELLVSAFALTPGKFATAR